MEVRPQGIPWESLSVSWHGTWAESWSASWCATSVQFTPWLKQSDIHNTQRMSQHAGFRQPHRFLAEQNQSDAVIWQTIHCGDPTWFVENGSSRWLTPLALLFVAGFHQPPSHQCTSETLKTNFLAASHLACCILGKVISGHIAYFGIIISI